MSQTCSSITKCLSSLTSVQNGERIASDNSAFYSAKVLYGNRVELGNQFKFNSYTDYLKYIRVKTELTSSRFGPNKPC